MDRRHDTAIEGVLEQPVEHGPADVGRILGRLFDIAMRMEREQHLGAGHYERTAGRRGYANGSL